MKKAISILLSVLMVSALFACSNGTGGEQSSPAGSPSASETPPASSQVPSEVPPSSSDPGAVSGLAGYITDDVDHQARRKYKICYAMPAMTIMHDNFVRAFSAVEDRFNFEFVTSASDSNNEVYLQNLEVMASTGVDGFFVDTDPNISSRVVEVLNDIGLPYLSFVNAMVDENNKVIAPVVMINSYHCGQIQAEWFAEHYKDYWPDVDIKDVACLSLSMTPSADLRARSEGAVETFKKLFPDNDLYFELDMSSAGMISADAAYDMAGPIFSTNPDVKYWWVNNCFEFFGQGIARLCEALDMEDRVLITSTAIDILTTEWDTGYDGNWVASEGISNYETCVPAALGLIALIDGRATKETLWRERAIPGDTYGDAFGIWYVETEMVTRDTYKDYLQKIKDKYGITE
ncbi:MAG: substrate-binding domain-containing protein [Oscillospiraceae bacterium]|nr:substrate-binding domain-containing protein [Oscillospiraceae bacterium]